MAIIEPLDENWGVEISRERNQRHTNYSIGGNNSNDSVAADAIKNVINEISKGGGR